MQTTMMTRALVMVSACALAACSEGSAEGEATTFGSIGSADTQDDDTTGSEAGDGDGDSGDGDEDSGDGDEGSGDGDGDEDSGDGDGDSGDGDSGDGDGDGDEDSGDGDGDSGDDGNETIPCDIPEAELAPVVPHVVLVLDKSGSMIQNTWDHDADPATPKITRWKSLHSVVNKIVMTFDDQFEFGAQLYPSTDATNEYSIDACLVNSPPEVLVAPNNAVQVLLGIPTANSNNIRGGTPAAAGMSSAIDHLIDIDDGDPAAIILVTDGAANCRSDAGSEFSRFESYDPNLLPIVGDAYNDLDIPTYVVGIDIADELTGVTNGNIFPPNGEPDGINPFDKLNELAVAGGKPLGGSADFYQTQNEIELQDAIQAIVDDAASCTLHLDPVPVFPELVEVEMDGAMVPKVTDCASEDGWVFSNPNGPYESLELCGSWCEQASDALDLQALYYCNPG
jgi:hypothetical protein